MDSDSNSGDFTSSWPDLPTDVLLAIAGRLGPLIGILRLRSVCRSWRFSLPISSSSTIDFPLKLPFPLFSSSSHSPPFPSSPNHLSLFRRSVYFLHPRGLPSLGFLLKVEEKLTPNTFSLYNPLTNEKIIHCSSINLLTYGVSLICHSYGVDSNLAQRVFKKVVVASGFFEEGDFVVLGLTDNGALLFWRIGDVGWTEVAYGRSFDDVISYRGNFFATADQKGRLVMIDSRLKPLDLVHSLMYGCGSCTHLVESDGDLYLVDCVRGDKGLELGVFKLDEKSRFWDYELNLNDNVFFLGHEINFAVSKNYHFEGVKNCIYFIDTFHEDNEDANLAVVFDMERKVLRSVFDSEQLRRLYWPPLSWFCTINLRMSTLS